MPTLLTLHFRTSKMFPLKRAFVYLLLTLNSRYLVSSTTPVNHVTTRPLVLLHKLISGQPSPVDRRKAVTIGFNRWLRPLTFQVPDVISNLIPSSSNIIKVHDDSKNKTVAMPTSEQKPNTFEPNQHPLMGYDPLQLITNFDQNAFLKGLPNGNSPIGNFGYPNSSFAFDESQLSNVQAPLFAMQHPQQYSGGQAHLAMHMNEKPYQTMPLYDHEESYHNKQENRQKPPLYHEPFYNQNEDDSAQHPNQHRYPMSNNEDQSKQSYEEQMSESHRNKDVYQSVRPPINYQGDYYPKEPHHRLPHLESGSGNYDYSRAFNEPGRSNFFSSMTENAAESSEKKNFPYKKHSIGLAYGFTSDYDKSDNERTNQMRPFYTGQHKENDMVSTERPYFREYTPGASNSFINESKFTSEHNSPGDFYNQATRLTKPSEDSVNGQTSEDKSNLFDGQQTKLEHMEPASYSSYFNTGFHSAASVLNPVMVKSEQREPSGSQDRSTMEKIPVIATANGVNVFPSAHHKTNLPRPVASRIKEFFKSMLTQKY